ncbi:jg14691 [Pararge aegeria aegeria]|uniref:Jg14691 protein n=1 Tax=Pararge aegeria aegeria TaxID=348720 RepID=A0A8S4QRF3_9NEOP|nr:jg14691 [Pararge aegeria aegeria]
MENTDDKNHLKNEMLNVIKITSDNVLKEPIESIKPKLTTIAEININDERNKILENSDALNEKSNKTVQSNLSVLDNVVDTIDKSNINIQNQITDTQNNKKYERNNYYENAKFDSEITPPKLKDTLHWPATPQRKGKLVSENPVYVLTSRKWLEIEEKKKHERETKEREKEERKKVREEKKNKVVEKVSKNYKNTKNLKINPKNTETLNGKRKVLKRSLKSELESKENNRKYKEETETKDRKRKQDMSINSTNIKKGKIDMYHNKTEKNSLKYDILILRRII